MESTAGIIHRILTEKLDDNQIKQIVVNVKAAAKGDYSMVLSIFLNRSLTC